jgi:hypothetical protein
MHFVTADIFVVLTRFLLYRILARSYTEPFPEAAFTAKFMYSGSNHKKLSSYLGTQVAEKQ